MAKKHQNCKSKKEIDVFIESGVEIRPINQFGQWTSNDRRYREYAHELLAELKTQCTEFLEDFPFEADHTITREAYPDLWKRDKTRYQTSDTIRIYSAMAVEGFLNFYGVLRLGNTVYDEWFEQLGLVPKLLRLLKVCDNLDVQKNDLITLFLDKVASSRNELVHPKASKIPDDTASYEPPSNKLPEIAQESVENMEAFFEAFLLAVPSVPTNILESKRDLTSRLFQPTIFCSD